MRRFENFCRALTNLREIETKSPPYDAITTAGMKKKFIAMFTALKDEIDKNWG